MGTTGGAASVARGRLLIVLAALLWSLSGAFTKAMQEPTPLGLHEPKPTPLQIAAWRSLFAGLALLPLLRPRDLSFRPALAATALCFAAMNALFISAVAEGTAANAILLQYTAPVWVYLFAVGVQGEALERRWVFTLLAVLLGIVLIVRGGWGTGQVRVILLGLGSGVTYAGVLIGLRAQRGASAVWLTVVNHLFSGVVLLAAVLWLLPGLGWTETPPRLRPGQYAVLLLFGTVQMGLPYWLMARGLRSVSAQEAGVLSLLEPLVQPLWTYLATLGTPRPEVPGPWTFAGGGCILGALVYRYWPRRPPDPGPAPAEAKEGK
jgi:drug/metabolite transporter (DMT)-like permease